MAWINLSRSRTKSKSFGDTWKVLQLGPTRQPAIAASIAPHPRDALTGLPLLPSPPRLDAFQTDGLPRQSRGSEPHFDSASPLSLPPPAPHHPHLSPLSFGPFQPFRCQTRDQTARCETLALEAAPAGGEGLHNAAEPCAEGGAARDGARDTDPRASQLQLVPVASNPTALPPVEAHSAWPSTWQERLRTAKRQRVDARDCGEAQARGTDWGNLEAELEEERRRKLRLGILNGMRQMLENPRLPANRAEKRKFVVRQGGFPRRVRATSGSAAPSAEGLSGESAASEEREAVAAAAAGHAHAVNGGAVRGAVAECATAAHDGRDDAARNGFGAAHASNVATVRRGGSSTGGARLDGGWSGQRGQGAEYEIESAQCAREAGGAVGDEDTAAEKLPRGCSVDEGGKEIAIARQQQRGLPGTAAHARSENAWCVLYPRGATRAAPTAAAAVAAAAGVSAAATPEAVAAAAAGAALAASVDFPLWVKQLRACGVGGAAGGVSAAAGGVSAASGGASVPASECTGETPGSVLDTPQEQSQGESQGDGSASSG